MNKIVAFRLTEKRENMLKAVRRKFKTKTLTETIDIALKQSLQDREDYQSRLESVRGSLKLRKESVELIRELRGR